MTRKNICVFQIFADRAMYYIQHGLMLVIPYYLLRLGGNNCLYLNPNNNDGCLIYISTCLTSFISIILRFSYILLLFPLGVYNIEPLSDMSWSVLGFGLNVGYHFWILQSVALVRMSDLFI